MATSPRLIPSIEHLRQHPDAAPLEARYGRAALVDALRDEAAAVREAARRGEAPPATTDAVGAAILAAATHRLAAALRPSLRPVINATGVIVHTNLGRAPLAEAALARVAEIGRGYSNLEYDLEAGGRGRRDVHAEALIRRLTGAAAAVVVNNNAAATLLLLAALARGREVLISRGELVEIGGGFRVPEIMAQSGAVLREVGTTNRTRLADYAAAIGDRTALILRVHPSNFRIEGFTERPAAADLAALGRRFGVTVAEDLGSGNLLGPAITGDAAGPIETTVQETLASGLDLVCFSGDKLLGGPQSGLIVGRDDLMATIRHHPLMRAFRVDKLTYAALEATLLEYAAGRARTTVPVAAMLSATAASVDHRSRCLAERLNGVAGVEATVLPGASAVGGGSAPGATMPTVLVAIEVDGCGPDALEARLRALDPPVVARIEAGRVVLDLRTVLPSQDDLLTRVLTEALRAGRRGGSEDAEEITAETRRR